MAAHENWIEKHRLHTELIIEDCRKENVPNRTTGGAMSLQESYEHVASSFGLTPVAPAVLPDTE